MKNRLWYLEFGTSEAIFSTCKNLHEDIDIMVDIEKFCSYEIPFFSPSVMVFLLIYPMDHL